MSGVLGIASRVGRCRPPRSAAFVLCGRAASASRSSSAGRRDLLVETGRRGLLRADDHEVAGRGKDEDAAPTIAPSVRGVSFRFTTAAPASAGHGGRCGSGRADVGEDRELDELPLVQSLLSARLEARRSARSGITASRERNRATPFCEYVEPVSVKLCPQPRRGRLRAGPEPTRESSSARRPRAGRARSGGARGPRRRGRQRRAERADTGALLGRESFCSDVLDHGNGRDRSDLRPDRRRARPACRSPRRRR